MAQITLTIPDAQLTRVVDALCYLGHWNADTGMTRNEFAKAEVARVIRERVIEVERKILREQASTQAAAIVEPPIT